MKKLINYEILMSIIVLGVFFAIFFSVGPYDDYAIVVCVTFIAVIVAAVAAAIAGAVAAAAAIAGAVAAAIAVAIAAAIAGAIAGAIAVAIAAAVVAAVVVAVGTNYAKENDLAREQVFASLAVEFVVIEVPILLVLF